MCEVLNKGAIKCKILLLLLVAKRVYISKSGFSEVIKYFLRKLIAGCQ